LTDLTMAPGGGRPGRQSQTSGPGTRLALRLIGLALLGHMLRSRGFYERMAVGAIVMAALRGINQQSRANTLARLAAWNKKQAQHIERRAERTAQHIERRAEREGKRLARKAKGQPALNQ
jgi:hypothetical protein